MLKLPMAEVGGGSYLPVPSWAMSRPQAPAGIALLVAVLGGQLGGHLK